MSRRKRLAIVEFKEVFDFASEKYDLHWNRCNALFFDTIFKYQGHAELVKEDLEEVVSCLSEDSESDDVLARQIMIEFMKTERLKECLVLSD